MACRFAVDGLAGLADRKRPGRPRVFPGPVVGEVKAMACEPPEARGIPQSRWSAADLATQAAQEGLVDSVSRSTVRRWLAEDAIRPWRYRSWIFPRDPDFAVNFGCSGPYGIDASAQADGNPDGEDAEDPGPAQDI